MQPEAVGDADELLDVVDAGNRVVGAASRAEVHRQRLRHRAVHVLVLRTDGAVFVQRRAEHKECAPGLWDTSAAGHVGHGESYAAAAPRELAEELGLHGECLVEVGQLPAGPDTGNEFVRVYRCVTQAEPRPDAHEIAASGWFTPAALTAWMGREPQAFTAVFRTIFARYAATP